jgi:hypothetical protein
LAAILLRPILLYLIFSLARSAFILDSPLAIEPMSILLLKEIEAQRLQKTTRIVISDLQRKQDERE